MINKNIHTLQVVKISVYHFVTENIIIYLSLINEDFLGNKVNEIKKIALVSVYIWHLK